MRPSRLGQGRHPRLYPDLEQRGWDDRPFEDYHREFPEFTASVGERPAGHAWEVTEYAPPTNIRSFTDRKGSAEIDYDQDVRESEGGLVRTRERALTAIESMTKRMTEGRNLRTGRRS